MTVKFGMSYGQYGSDSLRIHGGLRRRKAADPSTSQGTNTSAHGDIGFQAPSDQAIFQVDNK